MLRLALRLELTTYECESCGDEIPMPDEIADLFRDRDYEGERNICSTCACAEYLDRKEAREREKHHPEQLSPWDCDFCPVITECSGDCWRGIIVEQPKPKQKPGAQLLLFQKKK